MTVSDDEYGFEPEPEAETDWSYHLPRLLDHLMAGGDITPSEHERLSEAVHRGLAVGSGENPAAWALRERDQVWAEYAKERARSWVMKRQLRELGDLRFRMIAALAGDQASIAKSAGISPSTLSRAISGQRHLSADTRRRVIDAIVSQIVSGLMP